MSSRPTKKRSSTPGPKGGQADVKAALLAAGHALYKARGFDQISLRDVADEAGVNQAMVRYYFKDKHGFLTAMLDEGWDRLTRSSPPGTEPAELFEKLIAALNDMPWLPVLMMQCVYTSTELRAHFVKKHVPQMLEMLSGAIDARRGPASAHVVLSVLSILVFPHLARPLVGPVFGVRFDDQFARDLAAHLTAHFGPKGASHG
jgi:TetR/AcrR family transcriptional regulator